MEITDVRIEYITSDTATTNWGIAMKVINIVIPIALVTLTACQSSHADEPVTFIGYNVEGGFKSEAEVATVIGYIEKAPRSDIYVLSELTVSWSAPIAKSLGGYEYVVTANATDSTDSLGIFYDPQRFTPNWHKELKFNVHKYERPALHISLTDKLTGKEFIVMGNHLMRGRGPSNENRQKQAKQLTQWVQNQSLPVVALGDYNFDYDVETGKTNEAFKIFTDGNHWEWSKPTKLIKTGCHESYNSILDFVFIAGEYQSASSEILFREAAYCNDDNKRPDHRPVYAEVVW